MSTRDHSTVAVRCTTGGCQTPADATVTLPALAPGVLARPTLICAGCGSALQEAMPSVAGS